MTLPRFSSYLRPRGFVPTAADKALKRTQQSKAIKELWIIIASVIGFLLVIRVLRYVLRLFSARQSDVQPCLAGMKAEKVSPEAALPGGTGRVSLRQIPSAFASGFRIVAFRVQVPLGIGSASFAELSFIWAYIATMLILTFVDSECGASPCGYSTNRSRWLARDLQSWFYEDRAAHLASCQFPFIVALAGKNNIISSEYYVNHHYEKFRLKTARPVLTGIGHEKVSSCAAPV